MGSRNALLLELEPFCNTLRKFRGFVKVCESWPQTLYAHWSMSLIFVHFLVVATTYHFGLSIIKKECLVSLCTISFKTHPQQFIYCFSMFHMEIWELHVELYTNRCVFRLRHPIFALVHTQIFGHLTMSWVWLVIVKESIVIMMPNMEETEWCSMKTVPSSPYPISLIPSFTLHSVRRVSLPLPTRELNGEAVTLSEMWYLITLVVLSHSKFHRKRSWSFSFPFLNLRAFSTKNEYKMGSFKAYHCLLCWYTEKDWIKVGAGS